MLSNSILRRDVDGKLFKVVFLSHWSDITAMDGSGDADSVKCYGPDLYVSANKGHGYVDITGRDFLRGVFERLMPKGNFMREGADYVDVNTQAMWLSFYAGVRTLAEAISQK